MQNKEKKLILGPCALESRRHMHQTVANAQQRGIEIARLNLWKPRTKPGYEGVGEEGLPWITEASEAGITPAMEVLLPNHVELLLNAVAQSLVVWIGSRNQNHLVLRDIGMAVAGEDRIKLMVKNQPWRDKNHWRGMIEHLLCGGASQEQIWLCHRGFAPWDKSDTPLRNIPDWKMAEELRTETGLPMIADPSHIGGKREKVKLLMKELLDVPWVDGIIAEVHPDPDHAVTDIGQQMSWSDIDELLTENT